MKSIKTIITLLILASLTFLTSCQKEETAKVVSTSFTSSSWIYYAPSWVMYIDYPEITEEIINSGAVLVYVKVGDSYNQIPLTFFQTSTYSTSVEVSTYVGGVTVFWTDSDLTQPINPGPVTFKIVVIPISIINKNLNINYSNYSEVKAKLNLED